MSNPSWVDAFQIDESTLAKLRSQEPAGLSLIHKALLEGILPEEKYLSWAMEAFQAPGLQATFSLSKVPAQDLEFVRPLFPWRQDFLPAGVWGTTLYVLCHEPVPLKLEGFSICYVLAPAQVLKTSWQHFQGAADASAPEPEPVPQQPEAQAHEAQQAAAPDVISLGEPEPQPEPVPQQPEAQAHEAQQVSAPDVISLGEPEPQPEPVPQQPEAQDHEAHQAAQPEGLHLGTPAGDESQEASQGLSFEAPETEAAQASEVPEGLGSFQGFATSSAEEAEFQPEPAPEGLSAGSDALSSQEAETPEGLGGSPQKEDTPEGIFGDQDFAAKTEGLSFASLVNPVAAKTETQEESADSAQAPPPEAVSGPLSELPEVPQAAPQAVPPELAALKINSDAAAQLPPLPNPFGADQAPEPEPQAAAKVEPAPAPGPQEQAKPEPAAISSGGGGVYKTEWSLEEVSRVTPLKKDPETVTRTIEFTQLSSTRPDIQVCRAVSYEQVDKAPEEMPSAEHLEELTLSTFKAMRTYFPETIFLVFLNNQLTPWRWTQGWVRGTDAPPAFVDLSTPSIFKIAFQTGLPYHGYVVPSPVNNAFFNEWNNGILPDHITLMPVKVGGMLAGMVMGKAERSQLDYKYSLKFSEGLVATLSEAMGKLALKSAS